MQSNPVLSDPHPLQVLIPKLKESSGNMSVLTSVLVAVGELAQVSGPEMAVYADGLFSIIIVMLQVCPVC